MNYANVLNGLSSYLEDLNGGEVILILIGFIVWALVVAACMHDEKTLPPISVILTAGISVMIAVFLLTRITIQFHENTHLLAEAIELQDSDWVVYERKTQSTPYVGIDNGICRVRINWEGLQGDQTVLGSTQLGASTSVAMPIPRLLSQLDEQCGT